MECQHLNDAHVTWSVQGKLIYKDQCTKCFIEAKSDEGIAVCLKCFNGGCLHKHSPEHAKVHDHCVVMNIRLYEVELPPSQEPVTKLVIKDLPQLEIETKVMCLKCNKELKNEKLDALIQSVKMTESAFKRAAIAQWEDIPQPCEHTLTIQQQQNHKGNLKCCHNCDLSSNLWLCLVCGNIGCGRKAYDGSGGNNHAVDHFKQSGHCLVVKLGTITPEGSADIYCYACDTEVVDNYLKEHLASFGIAVEKQTKTEKSMAELNLDANIAFQLSKIFESGKQLNPIFGPGLTGIDNIGNSCYMNSVLQVLFSMPEFISTFTADHLEKCGKLPIGCQLCQCSKVVHGLNSGEFSIKKLSKSPLDVVGAVKDYYQEGLRLYDFKQIVAKGNKEFLSNRQQDALEYWGVFMSYLQKLEKSEKLPQLTKLFEYDSCQVLKCLGCNGHKLNHQKTTEFKIPVEQPTQQQVQAYYAAEEAKYQERLLTLKDGEEVRPFQIDDLPEYDTTFKRSLEIISAGEPVSIYCPRCQSNQIFNNREYFKNYPKYLFMPVNRFVLENWVPKKLNANIQIDQFQDFAEFRLPELAAKDEIKDQVKQEYTEDQLEALLAMGFGINRCKRALIKCKGDVEGAMMSIMETLDDPSYDDPIIQQQQAIVAEVPLESIEMISQMGFTQEQAKFALLKTDNNLERAMDYLFNHDLDLEMSLQQQQGQQQQQEEYTNNNSKYQLIGVIVHLGKSVHCGHYVCYLLKNNKWVLFNDAKVAECEDPNLSKGYMYIYRRLD